MLLKLMWWVMPVRPVNNTHDGKPVRDMMTLVYDKAPIAVARLGVGTLACYGAPHQKMDFYEINPLVVRIAENPDYFTYMRDCPSDKRIIVGDARLSLMHAP